MSELRDLYAAFDGLPDLLGRAVSDPEVREREFTKLVRSHPVVAHIWARRRINPRPTDLQIDNRDLLALVIFLGEEARILKEINQKLATMTVTNTIVIPRNDASEIRGD